MTQGWKVIYIQGKNHKDIKQIASGSPCREAFAVSIVAYHVSGDVLI